MVHPDELIWCIGLLGECRPRSKRLLQKTIFKETPCHRSRSGLSDCTRSLYRVHPACSVPLSVDFEGIVGTINQAPKYTASRLGTDLYPERNGTMKAPACLPLGCVNDQGYINGRIRRWNG